MRQRVTVLGCPVDLMERDEIERTVVSSSFGQSLIHIVTLNPEQIMAERRESRLAAIVANAELITIDGAGLAAALRVGGFKPVERVTGVNLTEKIAELGIPVFLLGGLPGAAEEAAIKLAGRFPNSEIVGSWSGGRPDPADDGTTVTRIAKSASKAVLVAYGAPAQCYWIERNRNALEQSGVRIAIGVGGALDYLSGQVARPPSLLQRIGLEWLVRLVRQPWRWKRQLVLPVFAAMATFEGVRRRIGIG